MDPADSPARPERYWEARCRAAAVHRGMATGVYADGGPELTKRIRRSDQALAAAPVAVGLYFLDPAVRLPGAAWATPSGSAMSSGRIASHGSTRPLDWRASRCHGGPSRSLSPRSRWRWIPFDASLPCGAFTRPTRPFSSRGFLTRSSAIRTQALAALVRHVEPKGGGSLRRAFVDLANSPVLFREAGDDAIGPHLRDVRGDHAAGRCARADVAKSESALPWLSLRHTPPAAARRRRAPSVLSRQPEASL